MSTGAPAPTDVLFAPLKIRSLELPNRIVMSPMTRERCPRGIPGPDVAAYYRRRAEGGTGLIITEGVAIDHPSAVDSPNVPRLHTAEARDGWRAVVDAVHAAGGKIVPQLWHVGPLWGAMAGVDPSVAPMRPSGLWGRPGHTYYPKDYIDRASLPTAAMTDDDIDGVIAAFARSARHAMQSGFDGIALHGGHGYLLDSFLWSATNRRDDHWGGDTERRTRFPAAVVRAIRQEIGPHMPIFFRFSQHKQQDYRARIADTPEELAVALNALVDAGVDVLDASVRRFDAPAFEGSPRSLAGWAKHLTGVPAMAVGSVGLGATLQESMGQGHSGTHDNIPELLRRLACGEFDLAGIGRMHLADPALTRRLRDAGPLPAFDRQLHQLPLH
ncbi:12-oxophytodienoate reductase [Streptomyces sp. NPDC059524]|uniref:oxidoreductase n=1 Tax=Streptomyces sp. NPDC059524 TaxID=3346856 RepID=UPI0036AE07A8